MESCRHESICALETGTGPISHTSPWSRNQRDPEGIPAVEDGGGRKGDRDTPGCGTPPPKVILAPDEGVVQVCSRPRAGTCLVNPQADHIIARRAVLLSIDGN